MSRAGETVAPGFGRAKRDLTDTTNCPVLLGLGRYVGLLYG